MKATMILGAMAAMLAVMPAAQAAQPSCGGRPNAERPLPTPVITIALASVQALQNPGNSCDRPDPARPTAPGSVVIA